MSLIGIVNHLHWNLAVVEFHVCSWNLWKWTQQTQLLAVMELTVWFGFCYSVSCHLQQLIYSIHDVCVSHFVQIS